MNQFFKISSRDQLDVVAFLNFKYLNKTISSRKCVVVELISCQRFNPKK